MGEAGEDGDKRQSAGRGWNHHTDCHGDRQYGKREEGVDRGGSRYTDPEMTGSQ